MDMEREELSGPDYLPGRKEFISGHINPVLSISGTERRNPLAELRNIEGTRRVLTRAPGEDAQRRISTEIPGDRV